MEFAGRRIVQLPSIQEYVHSIGTYPYLLLSFSSRFVLLPFEAWFPVCFPIPGFGVSAFGVVIIAVKMSAELHRFFSGGEEEICFIGERSERIIGKD